MASDLRRSAVRRSFCAGTFGARRSSSLILVAASGLFVSACSSGDDAATTPGPAKTEAENEGNGGSSGAPSRPTTTEQPQPHTGDGNTSVPDASKPIDIPSPDAASSVDDGARAKRTVVRVHHPEASHISIRGNAASLDWTRGTACVPVGTDVCELSLPAATSTVEWKPLIDDRTWSRGPNYGAPAGETTDVYPHFTVVRGSLQTFDPAFTSTALPSTRKITVYLPPTYAENPTARFPVLYMHDGQNLFDAGRAFGGSEWRVDETLDAAAESGAIREVIVVGVDNTSDRMNEYTPSRDASEGFGGKGDAYVALLANELKPRIDRDLRTLSGREATSILGSSLGGLISVHAGVKRPEVFGRIGAMSPSTWWNDAAIVDAVGTLSSASVRPLLVYVDSGDGGNGRGDDVVNTRALATAFRGVGFVDGVSLKYVVEPGGQHSESYWAGRLPAALAFLVGPGR